jgi:type I restriction enzyme, S subunit
MSNWIAKKLDIWVNSGDIVLGRGNIISKDDINTFLGSYPIYSSSAHNNGKFGEYAKHMFDEELITWSIDGGGNLFYRPRHKFSVTNVCGFMRIKTNELHTPFVYYCLSNQHKNLTFDYTTKAHPSVIRKIYWLPKIEIGAQEKIADILSTIDRTITHTEALIEKYQQIKAGLMHDLFTRGIGADGKLRPPRDQAPELYQESSIGWIPKEWKFEALNYGLSASPKNGYSPKEVENWQDVYVLGLGCLTKNGFSPAQLKNAPRSSLFSGAKLEDGDFLISRSNTQELVGLCGIYHDIGHNVIYPDLMIKLKFNKNLVGEFLEKYLLSKAARQRISAIAVGTSGSMVKINATTLKALKVIYPTPDEQLEIIEKLEPIENQISCLKTQFDKLKKQKSGLMHDLLTGTVQVNSDPV